MAEPARTGATPNRSSIARARRLLRMAPVLAGLAGAVFALAGAWIILSQNGRFAASEDTAAQVRALAERLAQAEGQRSRLNALENTMARAEPRLGLIETTRNSLAALQEKVESDIHRLDGNIKAGTNSAGVDAPAFTALVQRVDELAARLPAPDQTAEDKRLMALSLGALTLKDAVDKGQPFSSELDLVKNKLHAASNLEPLLAHAVTGIPTTAQLRARFTALAPALLAQDEPETHGWYDWLVTRARRLVNMRRVGDVPGAGVEALLARLETRLDQQDSAGALALFNQLPPQVRQAAQGLDNKGLDNKGLDKNWGDDLAARASADTLIRALMTTAATALYPARATP